MKVLIILSLIFTSACNLSSKKNNSDENKIEVRALKSGRGYIKKAKDSLYTFQNLNLNIDFIFDRKHKSLIRITKKPNSNDTMFTNRFFNYEKTSKDLTKYLPEKILDFELQGVYQSDPYENDVDVCCFYLHPKTKDVIQVTNLFYIGNPESVFLFSHNNTDLFKNKLSLLNEILRLNQQKQNTDSVSFKINLKH